MLHGSACFRDSFSNYVYRLTRMALRKTSSLLCTLLNLVPVGSVRAATIPYGRTLVNTHRECQLP